MDNQCSKDRNHSSIARAKLTQKKLESLTPEQQGKKLSDGDNLRGKIRVSKAGKVSVFFVWRYTISGKTREFYCGTWPDSTLGDIRKARTAAEARKDQGEDPALETKLGRMRKRIEENEKAAGLHERESALAAYLSRPTLLDVYRRWLSTGTDRKDTTELQRAFDKDVIPILGNTAIADITRAHVVGVLDAILARGARRLAARTLGELRQLFGFAIDRGCLENDPTHRLSKEKICGATTERARALTEDELIALARQLPAANLYRPTEIAIWLMLSTACRIGELVSARWDEIDLQRRTWRIPATKNGKPHDVFLSRFAIGQLEALRCLHHDTPWLYPRRPDGSGDGGDAEPGSLDPKAITRQIGDRQRSSGPLAKRAKNVATLRLSGGTWTPHDLRRTAATLMGDLGVRPDVIERCLNHTEPNRIVRTYQRQKLLDEQADAWRVLGERLELLVDTARSAGNIVMGRFDRAA